jgi:hypothetical protein
MGTKNPGSPGSLYQTDLIVVERCHFYIVQKHSAFFGNLAFFSHEFLCVYFRPDPENPFLLGFLAPHHSDHGTDAYGAKQQKFILK